MKIASPIALLSLLLLASCATSHPRASVDVQVAPGVNPWTSLDVQDRPGRLQFAIVSDRNGGYRDGVFRDALTKINALQPQFVIGVGDLIEGYTQDKARINEMYQRLDKEIALSERPFFFVPGNHDLTNETLIAEYQERRGRPYYHFVFQNCLFLVLDTEDPKPEHISDAQVAYVKDALAQNPQVRWTFVFMHKPLWAAEFQNDATNWNQIETLLGDRRYTVFAGHVHQYVKCVRNGHDYYVFATTGGGSQLLGAEVGLFDHIAWVTMGPDDAPRVTNLALNGILPNDIVTETAVKHLGEEGPHVRVQGQGVLLKPDQTTYDARVHVINDAPSPLQVELMCPSVDGCEVLPSAFRMEVASKAAQDFPVRLELSKAPARLPLYLPIHGNLAIQVPGEETARRCAAPEGLLAIDRAIDAPEQRAPVTIDGRLDEWTALPEVSDGNGLPYPDAFRKKAGWRGPEDLSCAFAVTHDAENVYLAIRVKDDAVVTAPGLFPWQQDSVEVRLDARSDPERSQGIGKNELNDFLLLALSPGQREKDFFAFDKLPQGVRAACEPIAGGYAAEFAIPVRYLNEKQGGPWQALRLNVTLDDLDKAGDYVKQLWWRPDWRDSLNYGGSGTCVRR